MAIPASIRNRNPGAMYPGKSAKKFGSLKTNIIGGGHKIAEFPTHEQGAAALFDLLRSASYVNSTIRTAIRKWSGGNSVDAYLAHIEKHSGYSPDVKLTPSFLETASSAVPLAKAMAAHEAGEEYPLSDKEWVKAHTLAFPAKPKSVAGGHLAVSLSEMGQREIPGTGPGKNNLTIMKWYEDVGLPQKNDEVPNCAAATGSWLKRGGMQYLETLTARDYCKYGTEVDKSDDSKWAVGDIGVIWRDSPDSWEGHVGIIVGWTKTHVIFRGGNQNNEVNETPYPRNRLLAVRRPVPAHKTTYETVKDSRSLSALVLSIVGLIFGGITNTVDVFFEFFANCGHLVFTAVQWFFDNASDTALSAASKIEPVRDFAVRNDIPFPVWVVIVYVLSQLAMVFYREFIRKRVRT